MFYRSEFQRLRFFGGAAVSLFGSLKSINEQYSACYKQKRFSREGGPLVPPRNLLVTAAALILSLGAAHAATVNSPNSVTLDYTVSYTKDVGRGPSITDDLGKKVKNSNQYTYTTPLLTPGSGGPGIFSTDVSFFTAGPSGSSGLGRGSNACTAITGNSDSVCGTITVEISVGTDTFTETGEYEAAYGGSELGCAVGDGKSPKSGKTDCIVWSGAADTYNGKAIKNMNIPGGQFLYMTFFNATDWSITPQINLALDDPTHTNPSPTPLPGTLPLFLSGLGAMGFLSRRKKRAAKIKTAR